MLNQNQSRTQLSYFTIRFKHSTLEAGGNKMQPELFQTF
jgi:hypothetical protein